jgi:hypothetical protein
LAGSTSTAVGSRGPTDCAVQHDAPLVVVLVRDPQTKTRSSPARAEDLAQCAPVDRPLVGPWPVDKIRPDSLGSCHGSAASRRRSCRVPDKFRGTNLGRGSSGLRPAAVVGRPLACWLLGPNAARLWPLPRSPHGRYSGMADQDSGEADIPPDAHGLLTGPLLTRQHRSRYKRSSLWLRCGKS